MRSGILQRSHRAPPNALRLPAALIAGIKHGSLHIACKRVHIYGQPGFAWIALPLMKERTRIQAGHAAGATIPVNIYLLFVLGVHGSSL